MMDIAGGGRGFQVPGKLRRARRRAHDRHTQGAGHVRAARLLAYGSLKPKIVTALVRRSRELGYVFTEDIVVRGVRRGPRRRRG
jgi:hypothetical protein